MPRNADLEPEVCPEIVWDAASGIEGWMTRAEADLLWRYCRAPWCEIGSYKGRSAVVLSARGRGYCVDIGEPWYQGRLPINVEFVKGDCLDVADQVPAPLSFLYLDADHEYDATMAAFHAYEDKVVDGGYIALHDALELHPGEMDWPGVNEAMLDIRAAGFLLVAAAHRVVVFRKL